MLCGKASEVLSTTARMISEGNSSSQAMRNRTWQALILDRRHLNAP